MIGLEVMAFPNLYTILLTPKVLMNKFLNSLTLAFMNFPKYRCSFGALGNLRAKRKDVPSMNIQETELKIEFQEWKEGSAVRLQSKDNEMKKVKLSNLISSGT